MLTQPDRPAGRGQQMRASPVKLLALDAQLPLAQPPTLKTPESRAELAQWAAGCSRRRRLWPHPAAAGAGAASPRLREHSWFAAAALARRCADPACDSRRRRGNRRHHHAARRGPRYRTHAARARAGRSARRTRPAICTTRCPSSARLRCIEALDGLAAGTLRPRAQPADGVSYAPKIEKSEAPLDWSASAIHLDRKVRAFNPWPDRRNAVCRRNACACCARGSPSPCGAHGAPGTLLGIADDGLRVACGEGVLAMRELQRAGKRPMSARDFANAVRLAGLRFGP